MSINFLTGVPGSGKTYFAVNLLKKEIDKKTRPIFTNINLKIPYNDYLHPFDYDDFYSFCKKELEFYESYKSDQSNKRKDDPNYTEIDNYDEALKKSGLLEKYGSALIIWDECHIDLSVDDPVIVRFFSYHRHFEGMDLLLITQSLDLIERKYKRFADKFFFGVNPAKRLLSTTFKYKVHTDHRGYEKSLIETISLPSDKKVFSLYDSGSYKINRSAFLKKMAPVVGLVLFLFLFIKYAYFGYFLHRNDKPVIDDSIPTSETLVDQEPRSVEDMKRDVLAEHDNYSDTSDLLPPPPLQQSQNNSNLSPAYTDQASLSRHLIRFQCTASYCYFPNNKYTLPISTLSAFMDEFGGKVLSMETITKDFSIITAVVPTELYYMIENHNIETRSDYYVPTSNQSGSVPTSPKFASPSGV